MKYYDFFHVYLLNQPSLQHCNESKRKNKKVKMNRKMTAKESSFESHKKRKNNGSSICTMSHILFFVFWSIVNFISHVISLNISSKLKVKMKY